MHDFDAPSRPAPLDQADGLRRMFAGRRRVVLPLVANPDATFSGVVLDRLAAELAAQGRQVLVVDASSTSPPTHEMAALDLAACVETVSSHVAYLPAGGLPMAYVDTRGCAGGFIDAMQRAAPQAEVLLLHADAQDLARIFKRRAARPLLIGADQPDSIKHAYAGAKLLVQRCSLMTFDLLLAAPPQSPRVTAIAQSLAGCAETFLGAVLLHTALIDPAGDPGAAPDAALANLLAAQLALDDTLTDTGLRPLPSVPSRAAQTARTVLR
ncbi:MAG: flagellar biosynthesis protein [Rubrivivax sp.]|nr:flagellar biosynthesis protein [Rubrivivax sp.]